MIRLVVFDMAGTTVNEDNVVYKTLQSSITDGGTPVSLDTVLEFGAGKEKLQAIRDVLMEVNGESNEALAVEIHTEFRKRLVKAYEELDVKPVAGAEQTFPALRAAGVKVALNTGYDRKTAFELLAKLGWTVDETVDAVVTASDVTRNRPQPDMIDKAMEILGIVNPLEVMKVGDSGIDIEEGKNAGCLLTIGITGGAQTASQLMEANPNYVIEDLQEIIAIIEKINL
jgi:phosphonatase-like hydrolase